MLLICGLNIIKLQGSTSLGDTLIYLPSTTHVYLAQKLLMNCWMVKVVLTMEIIPLDKVNNVI